MTRPPEVDRPDPLGVIGRRGLLRIGGVSVTMAAVLAACRDGGHDGSARPLPPKRARREITLMRTASSLEHVAVVVYSTAIDAGLITTPVVVELARLFRSHHEEHAERFAWATRDLGGRAFEGPNPAVLEQLKPVITAVQNEMETVKLAFDVETVAAQTYQASVGARRDSSLGAASMSVGGAEARHAAALALVLGATPVPSAFQTIDRALEAGTGV